MVAISWSGCLTWWPQRVVGMGSTGVGTLVGMLETSDVGGGMHLLCPHHQSEMVYDDYPTTMALVLPMEN